LVQALRRVLARLVAPLDARVWARLVARALVARALARGARVARFGALQREMATRTARVLYFKGAEGKSASSLLNEALDEEFGQILYTGGVDYPSLDPLYIIIIAILYIDISTGF